MKINVDSYKVDKPLDIDKDIKLVSFSDIHYGLIEELFYKEYLNKFYKYLMEKSKGVDAILVPGDLIFWLSKYQDSNYLKALSRDLKDLSYNLGAPLCISYGNHDLPFKESDLSEKERIYWSLKKYLDDRKNGVYVLDNEQVRFENLVVTGFSPSRDAYAPGAMPDKALNQAFETFVKCNFNFDNRDINVLLSHENKFFTYHENAKKLKNLYKNLTLILGGHLHDGYMPLWFQRIFKDSLKDYGIWEKVPASIDMCRGAFKVSENETSGVIFPSDDVINLSEKEALSIVNRGVAKYSWFIPSTPTFTEIEVGTSLKKTL